MLAWGLIGLCGVAGYYRASPASPMVVTVLMATFHTLLRVPYGPDLPWLFGFLIMTHAFYGAGRLIARLIPAGTPRAPAP